MSATFERIQAELAALNDIERAELVHFLIQSLDRASDTDFESSWDLELARRAEEIRSGCVNGELAESVFSELRAKYS